MKILKKYLTKGQYIPDVKIKYSIWLHHTVSSSWQSAWDWWNQTKQRVGTAYLIGRKGEIIECFDPSAVAYHLGIKGDDNFHEHHGIGIEMVTIGRLTKKGEKYYDTYNQIVPEVEVEILKRPYKKNRYYQKITSEQITSLCELIGHLVMRFPNIPIPHNFLDGFKYDGSIVKEHKPGIYSHGAVRSDKDDLFPQPNMIKALNRYFKKVDYKNPKEHHLG